MKKLLTLLFILSYTICMAQEIIPETFSGVLKTKIEDLNAIKILE